MHLLAHGPGRYLRSARLAAGPGGGATLWVIAWEPPGGERLLEIDLEPDGRPRGEREASVALPAIAALDHQTPPGPTSDPTVEQEAVHDGHRVRVEHGDGRSVVLYEPPSGRAVTVFAARGVAAAPAVHAVPDGAWVAFHHNVREDRGEPDIAKWIALRFVDRAGTVHEPVAEMTDRDRDREGVEQSFELPTLVVGPDGALLLFGRGSHNFYRQQLSRDGIAPRVPMSDGAWGCRGRRIAVAALEGGVLTARREKDGIVIERVPPPEGGRPALAPAAIEPRQPPRRTPLADANDPARRSGRRTLFGDIHQHSAHSDGIGTADEPYLRARHELGDDFCALTDHESFLGKRIGPGEWSYLCAVADRHDAPGEFATLHAYEWTGRMFPGPGHKVVYLPRAGLPIVSRDDVPEGRDVVRAAVELGGFAVPHHVGWSGADEAGHDPAGQPVWEICSCHGCYETDCHPLGARGERRDQNVLQMLRRGHRFGFIACSDSHGLVRHHGVARKRDPFRTGLTAVQAASCTRAAVLAAIRERRCYATSGAKILLDLRAGGAPMGSEVAARGSIEVEAEVTGTARIARIELVGKPGVIAASAPERRAATLAAAVPAAAAFVYARVTQQDGEMAWSSPIFFNAEGPG